MVTRRKTFADKLSKEKARPAVGRRRATKGVKYTRKASASTTKRKTAKTARSRRS